MTIKKVCRHFWRSLAFLFIFTQTVQAQTSVIRGMVKDSTGQPIPFVNVFLKGSTKGTQTDSTGNYSMQTADTGKVVLCVAGMGYAQAELSIHLNGGELLQDVVLRTSKAMLSTVTITAGAFEASDEKKSVALRSRDISTTAGAGGDISSVMNTLPGTQQIGEEEGLFVRGGSGAETKTVIDELIVQSPYFSSVPSVPQKGRFSAFLFKGTLFSTGGYSAQYGQALSSVLLLNTDDLPDNTSTSFGLLPFGGSAGHTERWKTSALSIEGNYANMQPYFSVMPQLTEWNKPPESVTGSVFFKKKTGDYGFYKFFGYAGSTSLSLNSPNPDNPSDPILFSNRNRNYYAFSNYRNVINQKWRYFLAAAYSSDTDHKLIDTIGIASQRSSMQAKVLFKRQLFKNSSDLKLGGEMQFSDASTEVNGYTSGLENLSHALFAEGEFYITRRLGLRTGLRYEYAELFPVARFAPRVSLAYKLTEFSTISLAYGDFYQHPETRFSLFNTTLETEHSRHYIASYQIELKKRLFRVELYHKEYDALIRYKRDSLSSTLNNSGYGFARGIDVFWRDNKVSFKNMDYWISYSYVDTKRNYLDFPVLATPSFAPAHNLSVVYKYNIRKIKSHIGFTYAYASGRPYYNPNLSDTLFNTSLTPEYHNLSLTLSKYGFLKDRHFYVIYMSVNNILDRKNVFGYTYSSDGLNRLEVLPGSLRSFFIGMFISLEKKKEIRLSHKSR